jgi:V8-like Glu-specific endopeptidase
MKNSKHRALLLLASVAAAGAATESVFAGGVTTSSRVQSRFAAVDFVHAKPMPLPRSSAAPNLAEHAKPPAVAFGPPGVSPGGQGSGIQSPVLLGKPAFIGEAATPQAVIPKEIGTGGIPYTTSRVKAYDNDTQFFYPFRAAGRLFFSKPGDTSSYWCSAGLIKPGVIVTAAHCVANFGQQQFYLNWTFVPAYRNGHAPYGTYTAVQATVLTSYYNGTDSCEQSGVTCQDDVAVILLNEVNNQYPGNVVGWFGYGWNGYSFNSQSQALITQLGYTETFVDGVEYALDGGNLQERTDSQGQTMSSLSNNTLIGSLQSDGSSGGPWVVNLGQPPVLTNISLGTAPNHNVIVGVTSWGYTDLTVKEQGASPFTTSNITVIVNNQCSTAPVGAC